MGRTWSLVSRVNIMGMGFCCLLVSFPPSLDAANQILLRNYSWSVSLCDYWGVGFPPVPAMSPQIRLDQQGHCITLTTELALEIGTWLMSGQWVLVLELLLELIRNALSSLTFSLSLFLSLCLGVARLEGWCQKSTASSLQPRGKACPGWWQFRRKSRQEMYSHDIFESF